MLRAVRLHLDAPEAGHDLAALLGLLVQQVEGQAAARLGGEVQADRDGDQPELDGAAPHRSCHGTSGAGRVLDGASGTRRRRAYPRTASGPARRAIERPGAILARVRSSIPPCRWSPRCATLFAGRAAARRLHRRGLERRPERVRARRCPPASSARWRRPPVRARCATWRSVTRTRSAMVSSRPTAGRTSWCASCDPTWTWTSSPTSRGAAPRPSDLIEDQLPRLVDLRPEFVTVQVGANDVICDTPSRPRSTAPTSAAILDTVLASGVAADRIVVVTTPDFTLTPTGAVAVEEAEVKQRSIREFNALLHEPRRRRGASRSWTSRPSATGCRRTRRWSRRTGCIRRASSTRAGPTWSPRPCAGCSQRDSRRRHRRRTVRARYRCHHDTDEMLAGPGRMSWARRVRRWLC